MIGGKIGQCFRFAIGPKDLDLVEAFMAAQPEMDAEIVLRQIAPATQYFPQLDQVSCRSPNPRIQREPIALYSFQLKTGPMVRRASLRTQDHWLADQVLDDSIESSIVEQIADCHPAAYLLNLHGWSHLSADVAKIAIMLIEE